MKKLLSVLLSICMLGAYAVTVSADSLAASYGVKVTEKENTVDVDIVCNGSMENVTGINVVINYNADKLSFAKETLASEISDNLSAGNWSSSGGDRKYSTTTLPEGYYYVGYSNKANPAVGVSGNDYKVTTITFDKKAEATSFSSDDVKALASYALNKRTTLYTSMKTASDTKATNFTDSQVINSFTAYVPPTPSTPTITIDPDSEETGVNNGIVDITKNDETGEYSVNVTAPIGKVAVIYINGVAQPGSSVSGTAAVDTTIKVAYDDITDDVITYVVPMSDIYGTDKGIAAFGKGAINDGDEYGIIFGGLNNTYENIVGYKFPATSHDNGIFAVEIADAEAGNYTAQAYVGDKTGAEVSFTK